MAWGIYQNLATYRFFLHKIKLFTFYLTSELVRVSNVSEYAVESEVRRKYYAGSVKQWKRNLMHKGEAIM